MKKNEIKKMTVAAVAVAGLAAVCLTGGCVQTGGLALEGGDAVDSLYYCECHRSGELMIEMWIDFRTRRIRLKCAPHDALGWSSHRFDSLRLDAVLAQGEMSGIQNSIRLAGIGDWRNVSDACGATFSPDSTWYLRLTTRSASVERFVGGTAPKGLEHIKAIVRFAHFHSGVYLDRGSRPFEGDWSWIETFI